MSEMITRARRRAASKVGRSSVADGSSAGDRGPSLGGGANAANRGDWDMGATAGKSSSAPPTTVAEAWARSADALSSAETW